MMTRWLMAIFVFLTVAGTAALTFSGCGDEPPAAEPDLSVLPDLSVKG